jgi:dihydroorotase-like cyclic amidohydrolase
MLLRDAWFAAKDKKRSNDKKEDNVLCLANCKILNTFHGVYEDELMDVIISGGIIQSVRTASQRSDGDGSVRIDCQGRVLMPGAV